ncbi:DnaJ-like protein [Cladobotryum mycophilum]|uniref:DnaJ-like protein n=1 Tax=Cladobotryum mycophilum TaxID=491253 RepID=A0ABR0SV67_9HYPO
MGGQQSSTEAQNEGNLVGTPKICYYELLSVDRQATDQEIKKAYRRKALELHPDRNLNDVESATKRFAEIQTAYEVLSDPQERAWYDSHRDAILSGEDGTNGDAEPTTFRNIRLTTTEEILSLMRKFNAAVPFDDEPTGFFGIARETFEHLALEEEAAADFEGVDCPDYTTFGSSDDNYEIVVKSFYNTWASFSTRKSFSWKDKYRLSDAPDRRVRRLMEKENKKLRDEAIREFNDAVRFLISFVRKRDPRYLPNSQTDADRQKSLRSAAAAQAARSRAANQEKLSTYEVPEWARARDNDSEQIQSSADEESEIEILECVVCSKTFKSDKQLEAHERSKKHVKALQQLRRQMQKEGADLNLEAEATVSNWTHREIDHGSALTLDSVQGQAEWIEAPAPSKANLDGEIKEIQDDVNDAFLAPDESYSPENSSNEEYAPRDEVETRLTSGITNSTITQTTTSQTDDAEGTSDPAKELSVGETGAQVKKIGKAKAKRQKKAALQASESEHRCSACGITFISRTKLFNHIREEDHAAPIFMLGNRINKNRKG